MGFRMTELSQGSSFYNVNLFLLFSNIKFDIKYKHFKHLRTIVILI
jgi:hypothetical protein